MINTKHLLVAAFIAFGSSCALTRTKADSDDSAGPADFGLGPDAPDGAATDSGGGDTAEDSGRAAPGPRGTVEVQAQIPAETGIFVRAGDRVAFSATGEWCWGGGEDCSDANGTFGRPFPDELPVLAEGAEFGELVGQVGGQLFRIGQHDNLIMPANGELMLGMSDRMGYYGDNSGSISVEVSLLP